MTNYERIKTMTTDELTEFLLSLTSLLNPSDCTGCPAEAYCGADENAFGDCSEALDSWLLAQSVWGRTHQEELQQRSLDDLASFLGRIGQGIFNESYCDDCPAARECGERDAENCEEGFRFWLEAEAEDDGDEDPEEDPDTEDALKARLYLFMPRAIREQENLFLNIIEQYEKDEQPDPEDKDLFDMIIERYLGGCGCIYCGKSTVPDRSPEKDVCTYADCARGLAEYINRMED